MTSGEPRPGTGPESLAQDPKAEAARLWQAAQVEFGAPAGLSPRDNDLRMRQEYIDKQRGFLSSSLDRDQASKEQVGHPVSLRQQKLDNSIVVRRKLAELPEQEKEVFLQQQERSVAASLANGIFFSRFEPDDQVFDRIRAIYTPEDRERIMGSLSNHILSYLRNNSIPVSDYHETGSDKYGPAELEDYRWLGRWRDYFEANLQWGITPPSKDHWDYRVREVEAQIVAAGGVVAPEGEPSSPAPSQKPVEPEAQPDPVQEAREALESELTAIGEFFEGKKPEIGILEDWQAEKMRRQKEWIREGHLAEDVNKWLENRIAPLIFQARLRGDDQIAKDLVNLCSPDQFDTLILAVGQLLKEATEKE